MLFLYQTMNFDRFSEWQVKHGRVSVLQIRVIVNNVKIVIEELSYLEKCLIPVLNNVFDKATAEEWVGTYLQPLMSKLIDVRDRGSRVIEQPPQPPRSKENRSVTFASDFVQEVPLVPQDILMPQQSQPLFDPIYDQPYYGPMQ